MHSQFVSKHGPGVPKTHKLRVPPEGRRKSRNQDGVGDESLKRVGFARCGGFLGKARGKKKDLSVGIGLFRFGDDGNRAMRRDISRVRLRDAWLVRLQESLHAK